MIKQLQSRIIKLEETIETNQKDFLKKKQNYEKIIEQLQQQNQKLKNIISQINLTHQEKQQPGHMTFPHPSELQQLSEYELKEGEDKFQSHQQTQIIKENNFLKQEIAAISLTYQKQMQLLTIQRREQLTKYFQKIKSSSRLSESYAIDIANSKQVSGKIAVLMSAYESLLKNYDSQKEKFTDKILELSKYLELTNEKNRTLLDEKIRLQKKYKNSEERLRLFRENLGVF